MKLKGGNLALLCLCALTASEAIARPASSKPEAELSTRARKPAVLQQRVDLALMRNPASAQLHFLRGLLYDATSTAGSEGRQLARIGYVSALRADPTYWPANYQLGLLAMDEGDSIAAEQLLIAAAHHAKDEARVFYALARAAYCSGDTNTAKLALQRAMSLKKPDRDEERVTAALVSAASGDKDSAQRWVNETAPSPNSQSSRYLQERVKILIGSSSASSNAVAGNARVSANNAPPTERKMAVVDVVIVRRQESQGSSSGINLMDALTLQFGSSLINSERDKVYDRLSSSTISDAVATSQNVNLTIPSVTYSLNIANASGNNSSIEARQTLLSYDGVTSKVFSGGTLTYSSSGQMSSQSYTKEVGLSLAVTPKFVAEDLVRLTIATAMETFVNGDAAGSFDESVQTQKSSSDITVDMSFGETVFVSGGRFENFESLSSRTPIIGSLPLIGNLFSKKGSKYSKDDLLIILSMRRDGGRLDQKSPEEINFIENLGYSLWEKLGFDIPSQDAHIAPEVHRPYFNLENPARSLDPGFIDHLGLGDTLASL